MGCASMAAVRTSLLYSGPVQRARRPPAFPDPRSGLRRVTSGRSARTNECGPDPGLAVFWRTAVTIVRIVFRPEGGRRAAS